MITIITVSKIIKLADCDEAAYVLCIIS